MVLVEASRRSDIWCWSLIVNVLSPKLAQHKVVSCLVQQMEVSHA